jgi:hypothetical protein
VGTIIKHAASIHKRIIAFDYIENRIKSMISLKNNNEKGKLLFWSVFFYEHGG